MKSRIVIVLLALATLSACARAEENTSDTGLRMLESCLQMDLLRML